MPKRKESAYDSLPRKQQKFVSVYSTDCTKTLKQCAMEAGYEAKNLSAVANKLLKQPNIISAIKEFRTNLKIQLRLDETYVLRNLRTIVQENIHTDPAVANRALELIGKTLGMYTDKTKIEGELVMKKLEDFM